MSADNGIYIAKFPEGYRVIHAQAIENIDFHPQGSFWWKETMKSYFGEAKSIETIQEALIEANRIYTEVQNYECSLGIIEYGLVVLGNYPSFMHETLQEYYERKLRLIQKVARKEIDPVPFHPDSNRLESIACIVDMSLKNGRSKSERQTDGKF